MSKRPAGKTKTTTPGGDRSPRDPDQIQRANLKRFTLKSWAVSARVLEQRRDGTAVHDLMGFLDWLGDKNAALIKKELPPIPCKTGCCYCCHVGIDLPDLLPPEALRIAAWLKSGGQAWLPHIENRLQADAATPGSGTSRIPCLLLHQDRCLIYPLRPMRCRAQNSPSVEACRQNYIGQRETIPLIGDLARLYQSLEVGLRLGLGQAGLQRGRLSLRGAIAIALHETDAMERWLKGEPLFDKVQLADETEERNLGRLARQARQEARAEEKLLQGLTATFMDRPGAWALYATSGVEPRLSIASS